ncbi:MAG: FtsW/RodA/SpoVE family cell cycle protein, partial [Anaerotardibacter sp.]
LGGARIKTILIVLALVSLFGVFAIASQPYRMDRLSMVDPWESADDESYQLIRSLKALAAGGLLGKGIGASYESFLTFSQSDFIFAIVGEEMGFIGATMVLLAFALIGYGGFRIAGLARDDYHMIIAGSLTAMMLAQAWLNVASVIGAGPTTGKPLPFLSAGGSSMISSMTTLGFLLMISICSDPTRGAKERRESNLQVVSSDSLRFEGGYESFPAHGEFDGRGRRVSSPSHGRRGPSQGTRGTVNLANPPRRTSQGNRYPQSPRRNDLSNDLDYSPRRNSRYR